jgi:hypothetical protein
MARTRRRSILDKFLEQEKTPVFTVVSLLITILVWGVVFIDLLHKPRDWGGIAQLFILIFVLLLGIAINSVVGGIAAYRGEYCGGRIAAVGVALWFLTILIFFRVRGNRLWP